MLAILSPCWICVRLRQRPARSALRWSWWKFGVWRISLPVSRRVRIARISSVRSAPKDARLPTNALVWEHSRERSDVLRTQLPEPIPVQCRLCRQDSARGETSGHSGPAANQIRAGHQSQDRQDARPRSAGDGTRPRRRGDRMMERREFITLISGAATWPLAARAQQPAMPVIGFIHSGTPAGMARSAAAFRSALGEAGFIEGQNVTVEYHWLEGDYNRAPALMADLVRRRVAVIATPGFSQGAVAAKAATATIPIVFGTGDDPVKLGLVSTLAQPGGNATGVNFFFAEVVAKRLALFHDLVP